MKIELEITVVNRKRKKQKVKKAQKEYRKQDLTCFSENLYTIAAMLEKSDLPGVMKEPFVKMHNAKLWAIEITNLQEKRIIKPESWLEELTEYVEKKLENLRKWER